METIRKLSIGKLHIQLTTPCSYINRAIVSQASRGFVSDSWPFMYIETVDRQAEIVGVKRRLLFLLTGPVLCDVIAARI